MTHTSLLLERIENFPGGMVEVWPTFISWAVWVTVGSLSYNDGNDYENVT